MINVKIKSYHSLMKKPIVKVIDGIRLPKKVLKILATIFIEGHLTKCIHLVNSKDLRNESNIFLVYRTYFSRQSIRNQCEGPNLMCILMLIKEKMQ